MKQKRGAVEVFLTRDFFNSLVSVLSNFIQADAENKYGIYAARLKQKIMRYSRSFIHHETENAVIYFYEDEAAMLIKLFSMYMNAMQQPTENYFCQLGKRKHHETNDAEKMNKGFGDFSPSAEQSEP